MSEAVDAQQVAAPPTSCWAKPPKIEVEPQPEPPPTTNGVGTAGVAEHRSQPSHSGTSSRDSSRSNSTSSKQSYGSNRGKWKGKGNGWENGKKGGKSKPLIIDPRLRVHELAPETKGEQVMERVAERIMNAVQPTHQGHLLRHHLLRYVMDVIQSYLIMLKWKAFVSPYGSIVQCTFLPDADFDIGVILLLNRGMDTSNLKAQVELVSQGLYLLLKSHNAANSMNTANKITDIQLINAKVQLIRFRLNGYEIDVTFQKPMGLKKSAMFERFNKYLNTIQPNRENMLKRYCILIKTWFTYEARATGGKKGLLSSYALEVFVIAVVNMFWREVQTPGRFLIKFFEFYANLDWESYVMTMYGPYDSLDRFVKLNKVKNEKPDEPNFPFRPSTAKHLLKDLRMVHVHAVQRYTKGSMNVLDPTDYSNNAASSVNKNTFKRMSKVFKFGHKVIQDVVSAAQECSGGDGMDKVVEQGIGTIFPCTEPIVKLANEAENNACIGIFGSIEKAQKRVAKDFDVYNNSGWMLANIELNIPLLSRSDMSVNELKREASFRKNSIAGSISGSVSGSDIASQHVG